MLYVMCSYVRISTNQDAYHTSDTAENFLYNNDSGAIHFTGSLLA